MSNEGVSDQDGSERAQQAGPLSLGVVVFLLGWAAFVCWAGCLLWGALAAVAWLWRVI
jgi:hypothetical protein